MTTKHVSVAGANSLLGQHLLARLHDDPGVEVVSLHDCLAHTSATCLSDSQQWYVDKDVATRLSNVPLLAPEAGAIAPVVLSFLPDEGAQEIEAQHLARGTRVITHCEYARSLVPLVLPTTKNIDRTAQHLATPNCTTAMCAPVLQALHNIYGITGTTITTLQAISGTDLPGMAAHIIHDRVVGNLESESYALSSELGVLFDGAFAIDAFATRVPVWRGHTITMAVQLEKTVNIKDVRNTLTNAMGIAVQSTPDVREHFAPDAPVATITSIKGGKQGILLVLKGDNLEMATTGLMHWALHACSAVD